MLKIVIEFTPQTTICNLTIQEIDLYKPAGFFLNPICVLYDCNCVM